jgi:hypothetical protein
LVSPVGGPHSAREVVGTAAIRNCMKTGVYNAQTTKRADLAPASSLSAGKQLLVQLQCRRAAFGALKRSRLF